MHKLLRSINKASESPIPLSQVTRSLEYTWDELHGRVGREKHSASPRLHLNSAIDNGVTDDILSHTEDEILGLFATRYDEWLYEEEVCDEFDHTKVRIRHYLDHLVRSGLLLGDEHEGNTFYELTAEGRDYVVANELDQ